MTIQELFIRSNEELLHVIKQISDSQWDLMMPKGTSRNPTSLADAVRYHTYDDAWVVDVLDGKTKEDVSDTYEFLRNIPDANIRNTYAKYNEVATDKIRGFTDLDTIVHLSYGEFTAHDYLQHIISFRGFRIYDIAKLIGLETELPFDLVQGLWDEFTPVVESYRQMGVFPPAITVPEDSSLQTKLLALVGRS
ncbi:MAG: hypothetical protein ABIQ04_02835 [Candidatus Saccharimonadales bacterium]